MPFRPKTPSIPGRYLAKFVSEKALDGFLFALEAESFELAGRGIEDFEPHRLSLQVLGFKASREVAISLASRTDLVEVVEPDQPARLARREQAAPGARRSASWGIDRIDQHRLPLNHCYDPPGNGGGAHVYVLDTGVDLDGQFEKRLLDRVTVFADGDPNDSDDHGTRVAGIIGAKDFGVANACYLHSVKVWSAGHGSTGTIADGLRWVRDQQTKLERTVIACLSVYVPFSETLNQVVRDTVAAGVLVVTAAGNDADDAGDYSPASASANGGVLTVGATYESDSMWESSNDGVAVTLLAPGVGITTIDGDDFTGTSAAAPHVAGVAAIFLGANGSAKPAEIKHAIVHNATEGVLTSTGDSPNLLLFSGVLLLPAEQEPPIARERQASEPVRRGRAKRGKSSPGRRSTGRRRPPAS
jgi:subtilisin family serine protease